jgi:hypothetical protein
MAGAVDSAAAAREEYDAVRSSVPGAGPRAALDALHASSIALGGSLSIASADDRFGVPTFVWAPRAASPPPRSSLSARPTAAIAARSYLGRLAPLYRMDAADAQGATLREVHDTGRGGIIASFRQTVDGVEVFRDEMKVLLDRNLDLVAVSGYLPGRRLLSAGTSRAFRLPGGDAVAAAVRDFSGAPGGSGGVIRSLGQAPGGYERFETGAGSLAPVRVKRVFFHLPDRLEPGYYLEVMDDADAYAYVISASDGSVLFRHSLTESDAYSYRVWTGGPPALVPLEAPKGDAETPHPTGLPNLYDPPFVAPGLVTLASGPISTGDPWLPPASTETVGNNVDAYVDLAAPDGLTTGDFRASITAPATFDRVFDTSLDPASSASQRMAAITQLFYTTNFLHDWYYDSGFDEISGNAQASNYGRGGIEGDALKAEAEDNSGTNNANMRTPADGGRPRMQMYVFIPPQAAKVTLGTTDYPVGTATFGPQSFSVTGEVALAVDGTAPTTDGCSTIVTNVAGKIALVDGGLCPYFGKVQNAQAAGAIGVIMADPTGYGYPPDMTGTSSATIPVLSVTTAVGNAIKAQLGAGPVTVTLSRLTQPNRDGTIDNQVVAHEWGHYISNRLIGDANGLTTLQARGLGEGWSDFHAMLLTVKAADALLPANPGFSGVYTVASYAISSSIVPTNSYYFGIRRYPYSTDLTKDPLTFRHIQNGVPLPAGPPVAFAADGLSNAEAHNTGEIWATMLWECYAALLTTPGRAFDDSRDRMRRYLVAAYKMTPIMPTLTEARDALLSVASASDPADFATFCQAFAKRGAGTGAVSPDRFSTDNVGVVESYACGGDLAFAGATIRDDLQSCDHDGILDRGETGTVMVSVRNTGASALGATTATVSSTNPSVTFPSGNSVSIPGSSPFATSAAPIPIRLIGATGLQAIDLELQLDNPALLVAGPRAATFATHGNADEAPSSVETFEADSLRWAIGGDTTLFQVPWAREQQASPINRYLHAPDPIGASDQWLASPPLAVAGAGSLQFQFRHSYSFEHDTTAFHDGGVIEISTDGGAAWSDIGAFATPGYGGTIFNGTGNPLAGRAGYVGQNGAYPNLETVSVNLGTAYAGKTVRVRFRRGSDRALGAPGWIVDDVAFLNLDGPPFAALVADTGACAFADAGGPPPRELTFAIAGPNPVSGPVRFSFTLPASSRVDLAVYDLAGRRVATVAGGDYGAGEHAAVWRGGAGGVSPAAGIYFARLVADGRQLIRRIVVVR